MFMKIGSGKDVKYKLGEEKSKNDLWGIRDGHGIERKEMCV